MKINKVNKKAKENIIKILNSINIKLNINNPFNLANNELQKLTINIDFSKRIIDYEILSLYDQSKLMVSKFVSDFSFEVKGLCKEFGFMAGIFIEGCFSERKKKTVNINQAKKIVISAINDALEGKAEISEQMQLIGGESLLDSLKLVEVCLALEDLADEHGFEFDWTSEAAMSKSRSMFRSVAALTEEFANQSEV